MANVRAPGRVLSLLFSYCAMSTTWGGRQIRHIHIHNTTVSLKKERETKEDFYFTLLPDRRRRRRRWRWCFVEETTKPLCHGPGSKKSLPGLSIMVGIHENTAGNPDKNWGLPERHGVKDLAAFQSSPGPKNQIQIECNTVLLLLTLMSKRKAAVA